MEQDVLSDEIKRFILEHLVEDDIYNEFSLQHELGVYLRHKFPDYKVQFERPVSRFGFQRTDFIKKEIDIAMTSRVDGSTLCAIELKFPRNGQHPEQMFSFCKDIVFAEQLKKAGFKESYVLIVVDDPLFCKGAGEGIYKFFRAGALLHGQVRKPTGKKNETLHVSGNYTVVWDNNSLHNYTLVRIQ